MWTFAIFGATVFLAYANGANDNFKGVATLFGSKTTNYKVAIWWATFTQGYFMLNLISQEINFLAKI